MRANLTLVLLMLLHCFSPAGRLGQSGASNFGDRNGQTCTNWAARVPT